jgi:hypothetical protein
MAARLTERLARAPASAKQLYDEYEFVLLGAGTLHLSVGGGNASAWVGDGRAPTCTVTMQAEDAEAIVMGRTNAMLLFIRGRIRVSDVGKAGRLGELLG